MNDHELAELAAAIAELVPETSERVITALGSEKLEYRELVERLEREDGAPSEWVLMRTLFILANAEEIDCEFIEGDISRLYLWNTTKSSAPQAILSE
jgi:succinylglutamate desuccinylase